MPGTVPTIQRPCNPCCCCNNIEVKWMHFTIPKKILILDTYRNANVMLIVSKCWLVLVLTLPRDCVTGRSTSAVSDAYHLTYDSRQLSNADTSTSLLNVECAIFDQICQTTGDIRHPCIITRVLMMGTRAPRHLSRVPRHVSRYKQLNTGEGRKLHSVSVLTRVPSYC